jgi:RNA ligase
MKLGEIMDPDALADLVARHYVTERCHPKLPLVIYNYTAKAQYERHWTPETLQARGLIVHEETDEIVARPFAKFFNLGEHEGPLPDEPFTAFEKMDGSLGIAYRDADGLPSIATRGSFVSSQALRASELLRMKYPHLLDELGSHLPAATFCFEIILPENRIVVDYGAREELVLLAAFGTEDHFEASPWLIGVAAGLRADGFPQPRTWSYSSLDEAVAAVEGPDFENGEGVVVRFRGGLRLKVKREEYVRLHRLVTGVTPRRIWEMLKDGEPPISRLYTGTPAGFQEWAREQVARIEDGFREVRRSAEVDFQTIPWRREDDNRAAFAALATGMRYPAILFRMYDEKPYDELAWKLVRPGAADPYRVAE